MIRVNLLPDHLRPVKRSPIPYIVVFFVFLIVLALMFSIFTKKHAQVARAQERLDQHNSELAGLQPVLQESEELRRTQGLLADKIAAIKEITSDRIIWSEHLYSLSRLAPDNFWYKRIAIESKPYREQRLQLNPQTKKMEPKMETVYRPTLTVEGYVAEDETGTKDVNVLMRATEEDEAFSSVFELQPSSFKDTEFEGFPVKSFTLQYIMHPRGPAS